MGIKWYLQYAWVMLNIFVLTPIVWIQNKYDDNLFNWFTNHLLHHGWYRGFNMYYDKEVIIDGKSEVVKVLAGPEYEKYDYYIQIW